MFTPELLSPAGSLKNMRYAFAYGADALGGAVGIGNQAYAQRQKRIGCAAGQAVGQQIAHGAQAGNAAQCRWRGGLHDGGGQLCKVHIFQAAGNQHAGAHIAVQIADLPQ